MQPFFFGLESSIKKRWNFKVTFPVFEAVTSVVFKKISFEIESDSCVAVSAVQQRSVCLENDQNLDKKATTQFLWRKKVVLARRKSTLPASKFFRISVALHNFKGGYGGLSKPEKTAAINFVLYLVHMKLFKELKDIERFIFD